MTNVEKQRDEICALQSIFETKFRLLRHHSEYEVLIDFDLVQPFILRCHDKTSLIHHLPPFSLMIHYHDEYPSVRPPAFTLSCSYFSTSSLQNLCRKLDTYPFIKGEVCIYDWIESIKQEINNELILDTAVAEPINDPRVLNGYSPENVDQIYQDLITYNTDHEEKQFQSHLQTCLICAGVTAGSDCIRLHCCGHFYCRSCLNNYVQMTLKNGRFGEKLLCPQSQCQKPLLPNEVQQILQDEQLYERYERLTLQQALELMNDVIWCPRCQSAVLVGKAEDNLAVCDQCHYTFCKKCREIYHFQETCPRDDLIKQARLQQEKQLERLRKQQEEDHERIQKEQEKEQKRLSKQQQKALAEKIKAEQQKKTAAERELLRQRYRELTIDLSEEDTLLEKVLNAERLEALNTQPCPNCHVRIEKNGGCLHMHCSRCDHDFYWSGPQGPQDPKIGSLLYQSSTSQSIDSVREEVNRKLDPTKAAEEDEKVTINNRSFLGAAIVKRVKACPDPSCRTLNVKMGDDNWMTCSECLERYCFACAEPIRGRHHFEKHCDRYSST